MKDNLDENKLELMRLTRAQNHANVSRMTNFRKIPKKNTSQESNKGARHSTFQLRFLMAVLLLACALLLDKSGLNMAGITGETIARVISADYEEHLEAWVATMVQ